MDIETNLPELLWRLVAIIPEGCMMRIGMTNPPYILNHLEVNTLNIIKCIVNLTITFMYLIGNSENFIPPESICIFACSSTIWK